MDLSRAIGWNFAGNLKTRSRKDREARLIKSGLAGRGGRVHSVWQASLARKPRSGRTQCSTLSRRWSQRPDLLRCATA